MAAQFAVFAEGLDALKINEGLTAEIHLAAQRAINKAADRGRTDAARRIREQIALPASYLSPSGGRLTVSQKATKDNLEARIRGRGQATSLARFISKSPTKGEGVTVTVKPGSSVFLPRAFLIKLRQGNQLTDTKFNSGLAIRLKPGHSMRHKLKPIRLGSGLFLLYGPSVDQVFATVRDDITPEVLDIMESEFLRLVDLNG